MWGLESIGFISLGIEWLLETFPTNHVTAYLKARCRRGKGEDHALLKRYVSRPQCKVQVKIHHHHPPNVRKRNTGVS